MKTVHRYNITAKVEGEIAYDPAKPETYVEALEAVNAIRKTLTAAGAKIVHDRSGPVQVRE